MHSKKATVAGLLTLLPFAAAAQPMTMELTAGNMLAQTHSHSLIMGVTGTFRKLSGRLDFDPTAKTCHLDVTLVVESLAFPNALIRSETMSKDFLDPAEYPTQHYSGSCVGDRLQGELTMRGQTHPFDMRVSYTTTSGQVTAIHTEGVLDRYQWGLNGLRMTVGKMIRVTNDISLNGRPPKPAS
jgi:polyisoprenoid-binding protein YceI